MAGTISVDEIQDTLNRIASQFDQFGNVVGKAMTDEERRNQAKTKLDAESRKTQEQLRSAIGGTITGLKNFGATLANSGGSFAPLNSVINLTTKAVGGLLGAIPIVGGALKGMAEGVGEAAKFMVESFDKAYTTFEQLSGSGIVSTFTDLKTTSEGLKLNFADTQKILQRSSKDLAIFGGSALKGAERFVNIGKEMENTRLEFQLLGIGLAEQKEYTADFINQQTKLGNLRGKTDKEIALGAEKYILELDQMTKLTGLSRKEQQAVRDAALSETRFRASLMDMDAAAQERAQQMNMLLAAKGGPAIAQGFRDLMSGAVTTDAAKQLVIQSGGSVQELIEKLKDGSLTVNQVFRQLGSDVGKTTKQFSQVGKYIGDTSVATKDLSQSINLANSAETQKDEELNKVLATQKTAKEGTDKLNKSMAEARLDMYDASRNIEQLGTDSSLAARAISIMSSAVKQLTGKLREVLGTGGNGTTQNQPSHVGQDYDPMTGIQIGGFSSGGAGVQSSASARQGIEKLNFKNRAENTGGGEITPELEQLANRINDEFQGQITFTALNDRYHQEKEDLKNSKHRVGKALDFVWNRPPTTAAEAAELKAQIAAMSGVAKVKDEYFADKGPKTTGPHFHVEVAKNGAVVKPSTGGTLMQIGEAGQSEAVVPMPNGRAIPVQFTTDSGVGKLFSEMNEKLETMIDLLSSGNKTQKDMLNSMA